MADAQVLSQAIESVWEIRVQSTGGLPIVLRKIGLEYHLFSVRGNQLFFFAKDEVGPGYPTVTLQNKLTVADVGSKKIIDGTEYTVAGAGGEVKIEPDWFGETRPPN